MSEIPVFFLHGLGYAGLLFLVSAGLTLVFGLMNVVNFAHGEFYTLGAYATDDFVWATGWDGHRLDLGVRTGGHTAIHAVGQLQRFKDSPREFERDVWARRYRLEWRIR